MTGPNLYIAPAGTTPEDNPWVPVGALTGAAGATCPDDVDVSRMTDLLAPGRYSRTVEFTWSPTPGMRRTLGLFHGVAPPSWLDEADLTFLWPAPGALTDAGGRFGAALANLLNTAAVGGVAAFTPRGGTRPLAEWVAVGGRLLAAGPTRDAVAAALAADLLTTRDDLGGC